MDNLGEAVERAVAQHRQHLAAAAGTRPPADPALTLFVTGVRPDQDMVTAGLTLSLIRLAPQYISGN